jgi:acetyl-CoA carboxylase carboxyltransferase component
MNYAVETVTGGMVYMSDIKMLGSAQKHCKGGGASDTLTGTQTAW